MSNTCIVMLLMGRMALNFLVNDLGLLEKTSDGLTKCHITNILYYPKKTKLNKYLFQYTTSASITVYSGKYLYTNLAYMN
jgi:hypothetical protein